uniref:Uncharacterized protein n=1 Tax=Triticum urartu TaxID=4572 RepID=A0A8R7UTG8_TRIUA
MCNIIWLLLLYRKLWGSNGKIFTVHCHSFMFGTFSKGYLPNQPQVLEKGDVLKSAAS